MNRIKSLLFLVLLLFILQTAITKGEIFKEELVLTLKYGIDIDVFFGPGEGEIGYAPKVFYVRNHILAIDNHGKHEIRLYDIKSKNFINVFPIPSGEVEDIVVDSKGDIYYLINRWSAKGKCIGSMVYKITKNSNSPFIPEFSMLPIYTKEKIYQNFSLDSKSKLDWEELFIDKHDNLYIRILGKIFQFNSKGDLVKMVPGVPNVDGNLFFWLTPEDEYLVGGRLLMYTKEEKKAESYNIPNVREDNLLFKKKYEYRREFIPIGGIDVNKNIYLLIQEKKEPDVIEKVGVVSYDILYNIIVLKFSYQGKISRVYRIPGPIADFKMKKEIRVTPDGSIYYWKYFKDRMELWRIPP
ncbi:MAG TPA: hypothetical protein PLN24_08580 [Victivallales bacterium]|nr:hypothetical protein [Victivallales bacterium]